jgi:hypothetical protein
MQQAIKLYVKVFSPMAALYAYTEDLINQGRIYGFVTTATDF